MDRSTTLERDELIALFFRVFAPRPDEHSLAILVDLPDDSRPDHESWSRRREMALSWTHSLVRSSLEPTLEASLYLYRNTRANNADLPQRVWAHRHGALPREVSELSEADQIPIESVFRDHTMIVAVTEFSATAPLKMAARAHRFRAATMPGFTEAMVPALRLDYGEVSRRVLLFKSLLDGAARADLTFRVEGVEGCHTLSIDLRHRSSHASTGLIHEAGTAGNLPSGEAYIVPYEGERSGDPSRTNGELPVEIDGEVMIFEIQKNRARSVRGQGPIASAEADHLIREPAYGNIAELGLGVLSELGVRPVGELLLDEKLGLHIAFGRSEHFGGQVGPAAFSRPEEVVHLDRVYLPSVQPNVRVVRMELVDPGDRRFLLMENDRFCCDFSVPPVW